MKIFLDFTYDVCWIVMWAAVYGLGLALYHGSGPALALGVLGVLARGVARYCEDVAEARDQK